MNDDTFWAEQRAIGTASRGQHAGPTSCGTCQDNVQAGKRVEHEECSQRATLLQAPDHPSYELLAGFSLKENAKLPARFHIPVFDDCGKPNAWLCAVCQEDGAVSLWPCKTAVEQGTKVFTPQHEAETAAKRQSDRLASLESENARLRAELAALPAPVVQTGLRDAEGQVWPTKGMHPRTVELVLRTNPLVQRTVRTSEWTEVTA